MSKLPDIIVHQKDFERDEEILVSQDDLYAITWETNFGDTPFEIAQNSDTEDTNPTTISTIPKDAPSDMVQNGVKNALNDNPSIAYW